ncbi:MAG TPA: hypothetical protein VJ576_16510 [Rhodocyclaceae bacterium]|nr:hypothetical protein [Rhodocyclaceae bacterium]
MEALVVIALSLGIVSSSLTIKDQLTKPAPEPVQVVQVANK